MSTEAQYASAAREALAVQGLDLKGWTVSRCPYPGRREFQFREGVNELVHLIRMEDYRFWLVDTPMRIGYVAELKRAWWDAPIGSPVDLESGEAER